MNRMPPESATRSRSTGTAGAAAIEMALIMPLFILMLSGLCDLGFGAFYSMQVAAAAAAGGRYAAEVWKRPVSPSYQ
jgi:Flp pilus assembly protein TadG